jgi:hypothetical protein
VLCVLLSVGECGAQTADSLKTDSAAGEKKHFELSVGQSLLFISDSKLEDIRQNEAVVVPTGAVLIFIEFRPTKTLRIPVFANIPTESKQFIVNNQLVNERASPTFGTGLQFRIAGLPIGKKSSVELEAGPLASVLFTDSNVMRFAPVAAGRFRFIKNRDFVIYLGASYSVGIDAMGLLFGTGYVF